MGISTHERQELIITEVYRNGRVLLRELALQLGISEATVRRDLKVLADERKLDLIHGGAVLPRSSDFSFHSKHMRNIEAKRMIGSLAAEMVGDNEQIFLDSGTTCFQMAQALMRKQNLTIVANSARLAMELNGAGLNIILLGGQYRPQRMDTVGPLSTQVLRNLRGYQAFIGADGLSMDFGLSANDIESASIFAQAISNARETVLLADHTKFATPSLYRIVGFDSISRVVTDEPLSKDWMDFLGEKGIDVILPG